jgi:tRNA (guanine37-N1)-methyltransferase
MKFEIVTLFPDYFSLSLKQSLIGRAWEKKLFDIGIVNLRDYATDKHHTVDETPFGGGGGMVLKLEPLDRCLQALGYRRRTETKAEPSETDRIILTSAAGRPFDQDTAIQYSLCDRLTIICGHYLGVDERILQLYQMDEVSIGNYVLSGGEPAAAVMIDAVARLMPKVLGNFESALDDSYMNPTVGTGTPVYTRPAEYEGLRVPEELMSGDHAKVKEFRHAEAIRKCARNRPDLLDLSALTEDERKLLDEK